MASRVITIKLAMQKPQITNNLDVIQKKIEHYNLVAFNYSKSATICIQ